MRKEELKDDICNMETLKERDKKLKELWREFGDIPMDPETECIEEAFMNFPAGTHRFEVWRFFDERFSKGVAALLYDDGVDRAPGLVALAARNILCEECMSETCAFNPEGICRFPLVYGRKPRLSEEGCSDWLFADYKDGEISE